MAFPGGSDSNEIYYNAGDLGSIPESGRSRRERNDNSLQYSFWEMPWSAEPSGLQFMGLQTVGHN